jgi:hypothetical protein
MGPLYDNFRKIVWTLPDDGSVEPKHVAIKSSNEPALLASKTN